MPLVVVAEMAVHTLGPSWVIWVKAKVLGLTLNGLTADSGGRRVFTAT